LEYLVIGEPSEDAKEIMKKAKAGLEYRSELKRKGKIVYFANFTGRRGGCAIYNVKSHAELHELLHNDPMYSFMEFNVIPLTPPEETIKLIERLHRD
jgi:muconolactone D-isomerase